MAATSSCQPIYDIGGGQTFVLRNNQSGEYLSAVSADPLQQISSSLNASRLWFTYDTTTLQIKSAYNGYCIDDFLYGYWSQSSTGDIPGLSGCGDNFTQQFVYQPGNEWLLNPNNGFDHCFDGNPTISHIFLWPCTVGATNLQWTITLICPPGTVIS